MNKLMRRPAEPTGWISRMAARLTSPLRRILAWSLSVSSIAGLVALSGRFMAAQVFEVALWMIATHVGGELLALLWPNLAWGIKNPSLLSKARLLGLRRIHLDGTLEIAFLRRLTREGTDVRAMFVSGATLLNALEGDLRELVGRGGKITFLLAHPTSDFIRDIDGIEGRSDQDSIALEVNASVEKLRSIVRRAREEHGDDVGLTSQYRILFDAPSFFSLHSGQLPLLCDPKRSSRGDEVFSRVLL